MSSGDYKFAWFLMFLVFLLVVHGARQEAELHRQFASEYGTPFDDY